MARLMERERFFAETHVGALGVRVRDLERDLDAQAAMEREENVAHAPLAERAHHLEALPDQRPRHEVSVVLAFHGTLEKRPFSH
jgi:hypothetical protein